MSIIRGLYAIAEAIDWHTEEMVQLQQMVKLLSSSHHHVIKSMVELLQETTYPVPQALEVPAELSSEESAIETPGNTNAKGEMEEEVEGEGLEEESQKREEEQPIPKLNPAAPALADATMAYQIINVNEMAKVVSLFWGDYSSKGEPADWFTEFQLSLPSTWSEAMKVDRFGLQLTAGSYVDEWFADLPSKDKVDMTALKAAFLKWWPSVKKPRWMRAQQQECIRALVLDKEDMGKWIETESGGDYGCVIWATKVMRLAMNMGDMEGKLIECVIEEMPTILRNELDDEYEGWDEFMEVVRKAKVKKMLRDRETKRGEQELRREVTELCWQMGQLAVQHTLKTYQQRPMMHATRENTALTYWSQHVRMSTIPLAMNENTVALRVPLTRAQILEKASVLPHHANTKVGRRLYEADIVAWH
ncbi:hypothetical protein EDD16DRAFT_1711553 [Pisolithus croceorrhizus]|nr:hypothetical protein EDD16DRAFT_1711553 [Pisolithus croceorrhizus]